MVGAVEIVFGLGETEPSDLVRLVSRVPAIIVASLSRAGTTFAVLPVAGVGARAEIVRSILELFVTKPEE